MILYLSFVLISLWSSIIWIGYLVGLFFMLDGGSGCGGCGGVGGCVGASMVLGSMLWSSVMYSSFSVRGG